MADVSCCRPQQQGLPQDLLNNPAVMHQLRQGISPHAAQQINLQRQQQQAAAAAAAAAVAQGHHHHHLPHQQSAYPHPHHGLGGLQGIPNRPQQGLTGQAQQVQLLQVGLLLLLNHEYKWGRDHHISTGLSSRPAMLAAVAPG